MDFVSKYQGVVGRVFRNDNSSNNDDSYVERLLDRISNGVLAEDRRNAMVELQAIVAESQTAQLAFGAMGFPVLLSVLKEERDDVEMVRGALETFLSALNPISHAKVSKDEVQPSLMNSDLLSREVESISLLLSLLSEEDFYIRYYTLQLLTALLSNSQNRLQEAILTIPRGITRLMDMLMDREVIRNEALLLLTYLTREAEEIQKIVVFEGAFEKIFSIIKEEGGSEGGVVVQDCLELLNNLIRKSTSNQVLLRETVGFDPLISILQLRGRTYKFTQQKTVNLISVLDTINSLLYGVPQTDNGKDSNVLANKTALVQKKAIDHLLVLGVESQWAPVAVRCMALRCIGDLVADYPKNRDALAKKVLGEDPRTQPALNSILSIILRTSSMQEVAAADHVFKSFCKGNPEGQAMLSSTLVSQPPTSDVAPLVEDVDRSFGSILLHGMSPTENDGDFESCCRASSVLSHVLKDNTQCKEKVLQIELEAPSLIGGTEPLMHRLVKYLTMSSSTSKDAKPGAYLQPIILKLLIIWLHNCPRAVQCFLESRHHLTFLLELISNENTTALVRGLSATLVGECALFNESHESTKNAHSIVDAISKKAGLTSFFLRFDEMQKSLSFGPTTEPTAAARKQPLARSASAGMSEIEDVNEIEAIEQRNEDHQHPMLVMACDSEFVGFVGGVEKIVRERIVEIYSRPVNQVAVVPAELEQKTGESDKDYIGRLKTFVEKQCREMQDLLTRNVALAEDLTRTDGGAHEPTRLEHGASNASDRFTIETLRRDLHEANQRLEALKTERSKVEAEASNQQKLARKLESDLESLSSAYNSLEQANFELEREVKALKDGGAAGPVADVEAIRAEAREEAQRESEAELNDLLVCLGQEQSKVEKLSTRLIELGDDVDKLLEGIGDDLAQEEEDDDDEDE